MKRISTLLVVACLACGGDRASTGVVHITIGPDGTWTRSNAAVTFHDQSDNIEYPVGVGADGKLTKLPGADRDVYVRY